MTELDPATRALVRLGAVVAQPDRDRLDAAARAAVEAGVPVLWGDELVLQSVLMVGYPRALTAGMAWRQATGRPAEWLENGADFGRVEDWRQRGEATCRIVYGANYDKLRANVTELHPALDAWMVAEGYGRTLSRPGLDLVRREFVVIAQVVMLGAERQLHSHLRGARNAGAAPAAIDEVVLIAGREAAPAHAALARSLWDRIR